MRFVVGVNCSITASIFAAFPSEDHGHRAAARVRRLDIDSSPPEFDRIDMLIYVCVCAKSGEQFAASMEPRCQIRARLEAIQLFMRAGRFPAPHLQRPVHCRSCDKPFGKAGAVALDEQTKGVLVACLCLCDHSRIAIVHHN